jgi:carbon monoxide dehydrogenase subunit G
MDFNSDWQKVAATDKATFDFLSDLRNFESLMPEQVIDYQADYDRCSFTIKGMADLHLLVTERQPNQRIRLIPEGKSPFEFELLANIRVIDQQTEVKISLAAELNPMLAMMAKRPLQNLVNIMADKLAVQRF